MRIRHARHVNQRKVLARRAALVELLYTGPAPPGVVVARAVAPRG